MSISRFSAVSRNPWLAGMRLRFRKPAVQRSKASGHLIIDGVLASSTQAGVILDDIGGLSHDPVPYLSLAGG